MIYEVSKRKMTMVLPVETISGKIARVQDKVVKGNKGFKMFVGYQRSYNTVTRFQVKQKPNLNKPTTAQLQIRDRFVTTIEAVATAKASPETWQQYREDWIKNPGKYNTLEGYVFAKEFSKLA